MSPLENDDGESICEERKKMMRGTLLTVKKKSCGRRWEKPSLFIGMESITSS